MDALAAASGDEEDGPRPRSGSAPALAPMSQPARVEQPAARLPQPSARKTKTDEEPAEDEEAVLAAALLGEEPPVEAETEDNEDAEETARPLLGEDDTDYVHVDRSQVLAAYRRGLAGAPASGRSSVASLSLPAAAAGVQVQQTGERLPEVASWRDWRGALQLVTVLSQQQLRLQKEFWLDVVQAARSHDADQQEPEVAEVSEPMELQPKVSAKLLSNNVKRLTTATEPYTYYFKRVRDIQRWTHPSETALILLVYIGACYYQLLVPVATGWLLSLFFRAYLQHIGYMKRRVVVKDTTDEDNSLRGRARRAYTVSRKVQNTLGTVADTLEKIQNLLTWKAPDETKRIVIILLVIFAASILLPFWVLRVAAKIYFGWRFFVIDAIYIRYPALRKKYKRSLFSKLPTNATLASAAVATATAVASNANSQGGSPSAGRRTVGAGGSGAGGSAALAAGAAASAAGGSGQVVAPPRRRGTGGPAAGASPDRAPAVPRMPPPNTYTDILEVLHVKNEKVLHVWQAVFFVEKKMTKPRHGRLALLETMLAFVRNEEDECITIALPRLSRMVKSTRTLIKLPVLEIYVKPAEAGETEETVYQFGTMTYASEVIAAIEEQLKVHRKTE